ncbi:putative cytochrome P450 76M5-like [Iris pallida]|uniref:Cytochrome P450 76M5-like n=1 Tax=Iris pallida TaxID=29817 RepID=A0AAX6I223_IRIPA|nr:putative cytochrome P450 76M5-like [Iris pallida]
MQGGSNSTQSLYYFAAAAVSALLLGYAVLRRRRRLSPPLPPGPTGVPVLGMIPFVDRELHTYFTKLSERYGPIYSIRIGSMLGVVISSPSLAREVLRDKDATLANHEPLGLARIITYGGNNVLWSPNGPTWRMLRRIIVQEMLSPAGLDAIYELRKGEVRAMVAGLRASEGRGVEVMELMALTMLKLVMSMLWGSTVEGEERNTVGKEFTDLVEEIVALLATPNLADFFPSLAGLDLQGLHRQMRGKLKHLDAIVDPIIRRKKEMGFKGRKMDFVDYMLRQEEEGGDTKMPFTMTHVKSTIVDIILGGTDTTSTTIEWAMAIMLQKPEIMRRAQEELDAVVGKDNIVEESHLPKLTYLAAVIKEVLRMWPIAPLLVPHYPSTTCTIGNYTIPRGSRVFLNAWAIHRDPTVWKDPLRFDPERFMGTTKWETSDMSYFPFGAGRRICVGITLADRMVMYALASMLHSFDWKVPEGTKLDLSERFGVVLRMIKPLVAVPIPRLSNPEQYL